MRPEGTRPNENELWAWANESQLEQGTSGLLEHRLRLIRERRLLRRVQRLAAGWTLTGGWSAALGVGFWIWLLSSSGLAYESLLLPFAVSLLPIGLSLLPMLFWRRARSELQRMLLHAPPEPYHMTVRYDRSSRSRQAVIVELTPIRGAGADASPLLVNLDWKLTEAWVAPGLEDEPVLVYQYGDGKPPFIVQNRRGALSILHV